MLLKLLRILPEKYMANILLPSCLDKNIHMDIQEGKNISIKKSRWSMQWQIKINQSS